MKARISWVITITAFAMFSLACGSGEPKAESTGQVASASVTDAITITTVSGLNTRRSTLINYVWGNNGVLNTTSCQDGNGGPVGITDLTPAQMDIPSGHLPQGTTVRRFTMAYPTASTCNGHPYDQSPYVNQVIGVADLYTPPSDPATTKVLVVLNPGHTCYYGDQNDPLNYESQHEQMVLDLLAEGKQVLATYMPGQNPIQCDANAVSHEGTNFGNHAALFANCKPGFPHPPIFYFLDPIRTALNCAAPAGHVHMAGLSGGGWTTTVYPALDTRIETSIHVAGSLPFELMGGVDTEEDPSQDHFYTIPNGPTTGHRDLYVMGSYGLRRKQIQVLNRDDDCCFSASDNGVPRDSAIRSYEGAVRNTVLTLGLGSFRVEINEADDCQLTSQSITGYAHDTHQVTTLSNTCDGGASDGATNGHVLPRTHEWSKFTRVNVVLAEINNSTRYLGVADNTNPFARGMGGDIYQSDGSGGWTDLHLAGVGTPAVVAGAVNQYDVFLRNNSNQLSHAFYDGQWHEDPQGSQPIVIISDPVAVGSPGRLDAFGIGPDYHITHLWYATGVGWGSEPAGNDFAVGQLAVSSSTPSRIDLFYRTGLWYGGDAVNTDVAHLRHSWTTTDGGSWSSEDTSGAIIKHYPTTNSGLWFGTWYLWWYAVGLDDTLYEGWTPTGNAPWSAGDVSYWTGTLSIPVMGSPSSRTVSPSVDIWAPVNGFPTSLMHYDYSNGWGAANEDGSQIDSPTATNQGAYTVDQYHHASNFGTDGHWHSLGGYLER